ncbi:MAG: hypothetical protein ACJ76Z_14445, partial [Thermoleophilaceae bacterium]
GQIQEQGLLGESAPAAESTPEGPAAAPDEPAVDEDAAQEIPSNPAPPPEEPASETPEQTSEEGDE